MLPALPTGMQSASSSSPSSSTSSNAAVFWPSIRNSLTELTSEIGWRRDEFADELQRLVEVAAQRDHARPVHQRLGELARRDLALGHDHAPAQPGTRRVRGGRRRRVAGRGADDRLGPLANRRRHRAGHPAVFERAGRVRSLELQPDLGAGALGEPRRASTSGVEPSSRVTTGSSGAERQPVAVALDDPGHRRQHVRDAVCRDRLRRDPARPCRSPRARRSA